MLKHPCLSDGAVPALGTVSVGTPTEVVDLCLTPLPIQNCGLKPQFVLLMAVELQQCLSSASLVLDGVGVGVGGNWFLLPK